MTRFLDGPAPRLVAHRGWHVGSLAGLENTMPAFGTAADAGLRYVETDVRATRDGALVTFHDEMLDRVTDATGAVADHTWQDLQRVRVRSSEPIPLFADVLRAFPGTRFNVDAKCDAAVGPLIDLLRDADFADRVCLASFSGRRLRVLRRALGPGVASSLSPSEILPLMDRTARWTRKSVTAAGAVAVQVPVRYRRMQIVTPGFVQRAHGAGLEVHVWTVDDPGEAARLLDIGVDGIISDRPDLLSELVADRRPPV